MLTTLLRARIASPAIACAFIGATCFSTPLFAHGNHTHGHGTAKVEIEGNTLSVTIDAPLESYLGYDYPPQGDAQEKVWQTFKARLKSPLSFVEPAADARCQISTQQSTPDPATADPKVDIANIVYRVSFKCEQIDALKSLSFTAFQQHPGLKQLRVQWQSPTQRKTITVRPRFPAITL